MIMIRRKDRRDGGSPALFEPGDLVRHRRYGYRAVVVDYDLTCAASDEWYRSNQTQPVRDQPWYHLLVDRAAHTTYAAEENLESDPSGLEISHPLLRHFFEAFEQGSYVRNDRPWPAG
jgi:heat shock protein HspQ